MVSHASVAQPLDIDTPTLERLAVGAWVPEVMQELDGWLLRASEGFTGRGNSALVLSTPTDGLGDPSTDEAAHLGTRLAAVRAWYDGHGLPPLVAVPLPTFRAVHDHMVADGWTVHHGGRVLVRGLDGLAPRTPDRPVHLGSELTDDWLARYHYRGGDLPSVGHRMLARGKVVALAAVRVDDEVVAIARGVVTAGWLGINAVETARTHRRRGLATDLLAALARWGRSNGAQAVFLQVDLANDTALTMYERAGFVEHHTYHYLQPSP